MGSISHTFTVGSFAQADWVTQTPLRATETAVTLTTQRGGSDELVVGQDIITYGARGGITHEVSTIADVTSGFQFSIDTKHLTGASVSGTIQALTCVEAGGGSINRCFPELINVNVTWTGRGPIQRRPTTEDDIEVTNFLYHLVMRTSGPTRGAVASGVVSRLTASPAQVSSASFGEMNTGVMFLCLDDGCAN